MGSTPAWITNYRRWPWLLAHTLDAAAEVCLRRSYTQELGTWPFRLRAEQCNRPKSFRCPNAVVILHLHVGLSNPRSALFGITPMACSRCQKRREQLLANRPAVIQSINSTLSAATLTALGWQKTCAVCGTKTDPASFPEACTQKCECKR